MIVQQSQLCRPLLNAHDVYKSSQVKKSHTQLAMT